MTSIRIEAEDMALTTYSTESGNFASNGKLISLRNAPRTTGSAKAVFTGASGIYDVVLGYYDENDGISQLQVSVGGDRLDGWELNKNLGSGKASPQSLVRRTVKTGLSLKPGTAIEIQARANQTEWARVDYIEFIQRKLKGTDAAETLTGMPEAISLTVVEATTP